ncbi:MULTISPECIES: formate dehydrogenase accessory protein FdhE [unclassified Ensifer]|uniref:formate dehydrogenase accessory protein FdhE n=1 Tax=unclassified Ensifer TaxID=2633371 RepID=UPI000813B9EC|nr:MULTISPECIES: formate dehydrogenase accessory protein FdhE [unclassified Ensifer]OCP16029.1 formate dehydrogenase accessory protein FdhE [Ensifer sp. LC384]OCP20098.1 formate dehydrogenase accessory protein FdhE [Ensifer sp. LC54]
MSISSVQPDPAMIGGIPKAPFVLMHNPTRLFRDRAARFKVLAESSRLAPYLRFLADIAAIQDDLLSSLPPLQPISGEQRERARDNAMPPIDRSTMGASADCRDTVRQFLARAEQLEMPKAAVEALAQIVATDNETLGWMIDNIAADNLPAESLAHHLFVAAAVQIHAVRLAAGLDPGHLVPVSIGVCPACGGKPVASLVVGFHGAEGTRYAVCACCSTKWNEVRVKCLSCGSTKGIGYRAVETGDEEATVKAEVCDSCHGWTKIMYQNRNPALDAVADDVGSLGLDALMKDTGYKRAGFNPFLVGY